MEDRELLESAAKAVGMNVLTVPWPRNPDGWFWCEHSSEGSGLFRTAAQGTRWNPLADDGDAMRLAVVRRVDVVYLGAATVQARAGDGPIATEYVNTGGDHAEATRRAIVRAVAALATAPDA